MLMLTTIDTDGGIGSNVCMKAGMPETLNVARGSSPFDWEKDSSRSRSLLFFVIAMPMKAAYVGALGPMGLYGPIATLWNRGAYQLKFPADQLKLNGCVHFTKETCICGFKMSKKWSFGPIQNDARPIVAARRPHMEDSD